MMDKLALIKGRAVTDEMASYVSESLGKNFCEVEVKDFPDGEIYCHIEETVRGKKCFVFQPLCRSSEHSINDNIMELLLFIDALKRASAKQISAVLPYYGYSRQDRKTTGREPISGKLLANIITEAGADRVLTMDLHAGQIQGFFDIPVDNLSPNIDQVTVLAVKQLLEKMEREVKFGALDVGSLKRTRNLAEKFNKEMVIIDKRRTEDDQVEVLNLIGEAKGFNIIFVDDIISTAGTLIEGVRFIKRKESKKVWAIATHGIFAQPAISRIEKSPIEKVIVSDTVPPLERVKNCSKVEYLNIGQVFGKTTKRIYEERSVSELFDHT